MGVSLDRINELLKEYEKSANFQVAAQMRFEDLLEDGKTKTIAGDEIISDDIISNAVADLMICIRYAAERAGVPDSVMEHITFYTPSEHYLITNFKVVFISFDGDLSRMSLKVKPPDDYTDEDFKHTALYDNYGGRTGGGIDNIVALFNNGVKEKNVKSVYGIWEDHYNNAVIRSKPYRPSLHFIKQGITDFYGNFNYPNVTIEVSDEYDM